MRSTARRRRLVALAALACACAQEPRPPVRVIIPAGASFHVVTDSLVRAGVVSLPKVFRIYATLTGRDRRVKAGTYLVAPTPWWPRLLRELTEGRGILHTVTIPEGLTLAAIEPLVTRALDTPPDSVHAAARDSALLRSLSIPTSTLEGYIYPDTYQFPDGTLAREAVVTMVRRFQACWDPAWDARLDTLAMSRHDIVTLASIIEMETGMAEEGPLVSAVYHNRLREGMLLQADPTVQYAKGTHSSRVTYDDLEIDSPYNTYRYPNLPPGPIASPGCGSISAALYPAHVAYKFFVAESDGRHAFRITYAQHLAARAAILEKARQAAAAAAAP